MTLTWREADGARQRWAAGHGHGHGHAEGWGGHAGCERGRGVSLGAVVKR